MTAGLAVAALCATVILALTAVGIGVVNANQLERIRRHINGQAAVTGRHAQGRRTGGVTGVNVGTVRATSVDLRAEHPAAGVSTWAEREQGYVTDKTRQQ